MLKTVNGIDYIDIWDYHDKKIPFNIFIGGRGTGKTYSGLAEAVESKKQFVYMRRLNSELELNADPDMEESNPFIWYNQDYDTNIGMQMINQRAAGIYHRTLDEVKGVNKPYGSPIGYGLALSTLAKLRGINLKNTYYWLYDEFIREAHVARLKNEGDALFNAYETINRNRELLGGEPIYMDLCSNSTNIYNDIFVALGVVLDVEKMIAKGQTDLYLEERGLGIHLLKASESFEKAKKNTAIGRLTKGTRFYDSSYENVFSYDDFSLVKYVKLTGWLPVYGFESKQANCEGTIYKNKGERKWHVSYAAAKCNRMNLDLKHDNIRFRQMLALRLQKLYSEGNLTFESYQLKSVILENIF